MRERIFSVMNSMPPGGLALHGTSLKNARSISKQGLICTGYHTVIPNPNSRAFIRSKERVDDEFSFFSKTMGSIVFALGYSFKEAKKDPDHQPAIVIFSDWSESSANMFNHLGTDTNTILVRDYKNGYIEDSFGKSVRNIPAEYVSAISYLTKEELNNYKIKADQRPHEYDKLLKNALILKTLLLIEKISFNIKRPDDVLEL